MQATLVSRQVLPFVALFGALIGATILIDALLHHFDLVWVGRYLGIPGTLLILSSFFYSMRKRKLIVFGKPKALLAMHETRL